MTNANWAGVGVLFSIIVLMVGVIIGSVLMETKYKDPTVYYSDGGDDGF